MWGPRANGGERLPRGSVPKTSSMRADPALHLLALVLDRDVEDARVVVAVVADLDPLLRDVAAGARMLVDHLARDHERRRDLPAVEQVEDARDARADVVVPA